MCSWLISVSMMFSRVIRVVACISTWFILWLNMIPYYRYTNYPFVYPFDEILSSHFLTIKNNVVMNSVIKLLCGHMFSVLLCIYIGVELLGHIIALCLTFWGTAKLFSTAATPFYIPTCRVWAFQFLHIFDNTCYYLF